ncbi:MAG TPA: CvpA family protein [Deltaproteobacteria bacterium]|nr:CvpA family protein [Deltaproteobacteria bacterium]HPR55672.1 CvpA family protein [Deltaproteobacteria bacterium]HXK48074.1 CvpA family protein [Deltaproteobacteria bacterium]
MNALDILSIILVVVFTGLGVYQGLIKSVSSFVAIIGGLFLAKRFSFEVSHFLSVLHVADVRGVLGFIVVFIFFFIIIKILMHFLQKILNASVLASFDTAFGGLFGFLKGFILALMLAAILQVILPKNSAILVNSKTLPVTKKAAVLIMGFMPEQMKPYIQETTRKIIK